ncbi:MAG: 23S rRNA (uracil-5-)-methyltransferase RumA, partial [Bacteroidia bacterium]|nr:23S rRNA (uracil-5-)-methyltransferase RumA [Bacteroidia bacterium]
MARRNRKKVFEKVEVVDTANRGKAVAKTGDGQVIFLNHAVPGDVVDIETYKKRRSFYEGRVTKYHRFSEKRTEPKCEHFGICGGCKWQNMSYDAQLEFKQKEVENNLKRIGQVDIPEILQIIPSPDIFYYRNKMEFSFSDNRWLSTEELNSSVQFENKNGLGFHIPGKWDKVLDINKCWLQADPSNSIRNAVKDFANANKLSFFDLREQNGFLRTLMIRTSSSGEIMVLIQFYEDHADMRERLLDHLQHRFPEITSLLYVINTKANDTLYDQNVVCYHGRDYILENMEGLSFKINAKSFYQTNSKQALELYKVAREFAALSGTELVYDLYT